MLHAGLEEYIRNNLAGNGDSCRQRRLGRWAAGMVEQAEKTGVTLFVPFRLKPIDVTKAIGVLIVRNRPERGMAPFRAASPSS